MIFYIHMWGTLIFGQTLIIFAFAIVVTLQKLPLTHLFLLCNTSKLFRPFSAWKHLALKLFLKEDIYSVTRSFIDDLPQKV